MNSKSTLKQSLTDSAILDEFTINAIVEEPDNKSSWYINVMVGFSAWLGGLIIVASLAISFSKLLFNFGGVGLGIICMGISILISRSDDYENSIFLDQLLATFNLIGFVWICVSIEYTYRSLDFSILLIIFVIQSINVALFKNKTGQFLGTIFGLGSLGFYLYVKIGPIGFELVVVVVFMLIYLSFNKKAEIIEKFGLNSYQAVSWGIYIILLASLIYLGTKSFIKEEMILQELFDWNVPYILLIFSICFNSFLIKQNLNKLKINFYIGLVFILGLAFSTYQHPEIPICLSLVVLSFSYNESYKLRLSIIALVIFIVYFYYSLKFTLLVKSLSLMGTGILFLISALFYRKVSENG